MVLEELQKTDSFLHEGRRQFVATENDTQQQPKEHNLIYNLNYQFPDDTNIMQSNKSLQDFAKQMN